MKVRMQAGEVHNLLECIKLTYEADGFRGFYYGLSSPLYSVPIVNAVVFGAYAQANWFIPAEQSHLTWMLAGSYAGLVNCSVVVPVELIKCKMQAQSHDPHLGRDTHYHGSLDCAMQTYKQEGIRGLYKGGVITMMREIPGYASQFVAYEVAKEMFRKLLKVEEIPLWTSFLCGMFGGFNCWFWSYPQDTIKTQLQVGVDFEIKKAWDGGAMQVARHIYRVSGWRGFWMGFSAATLRSTLPNGCGFLAYEIAIDFLHNRYK